MARGNDIIYELPEEWREPRGYGDYKISQKTLDEAGFYVTMDWHYVDTPEGRSVRAIGPFTGRRYTVHLGIIPDRNNSAEIDGIGTRAEYRFWDLILDCEKRETKSTWNGIAPEVYQNDYENIIRKSQSKSQPTFNDMVKEQRDKNIGKMRGTIDSDNGDLVENYETVLSFLEDCYGWRQDSRLAQAIDLIRSLKNDAEEGMF